MLTSAFAAYYNDTWRDGEISRPDNICRRVSNPELEGVKTRRRALKKKWTKYTSSVVEFSLYRQVGLFVNLHYCVFALPFIAMCLFLMPRLAVSLVLLATYLKLS
ncbi:hypothetical protein JTE90_012332 [Oedothorax gibbosus]|uniref:Uncharacterized protein n=1 Tax=Oedothorax gibbosus TaxID=931172 RepID=A0AAV6VLA7_9ARAC|nr:hypothetical protein JTE90_012332 [Oedothorax gibbosus]